MKKLALSFLTCIMFSSLTFALEDVLLISINKTVPPEDVNIALTDLERIDLPPGSNHLTALSDTPLGPNPHPTVTGNN